MILIDEQRSIPLAVLETDGSIRVVVVPYLSEQAWEFLRDSLDRYKPAIVKSETPANGRAIGSGDALPGEVD